MRKPSSMLRWLGCKVQFLGIAAILGCCGVVPAQELDFNRDVRPILSAKCFQCHGPDEQSRAADLRLDIADTDDSGLAREVIVAGNAAASELLRRVRSTDGDEVMPPPDSHLEPLDEAEQKVLEQWIASGAEYKAFWAFVAPEPQAPPRTAQEAPPGWPANRIDHFVLAELSKQGLKPTPRADRRKLLRRLHFDLTGLPPTPDQIRAFLADQRSDAWERKVEELLAMPAYGEHMARYWLDLARFADTNGIHHDHYREMTPYRDWVIDAFNTNLPFDQFVRDQVAGDLLEAPTQSQLIASGYNRLHLVIDRGTAIPEESFHRNVVDRVSAFGTAFLGLTVGCAECHDHKYDPISQKDFYQLYAFFNNIDATPETPGRNTHPPFIRLASEGQKKKLAEFESSLQELRQAKRNVEVRLKQLAKDSKGDTSDAEADGVPNKESRIAELHAKLAEEQKQVKTELDALAKQKQQFEAKIPVSLIMKERSEVRPTHIRVRGAYDQLGQEVQRDTPDFLPPLRSDGDVKSRLDLANWLTSKEHPLLARVTVNRFWQQFFGVGLVKTAEDFGTQGEWPSHAALLDNLAYEFRDSGWDVKQLIREIVTSQTYQQDSAASFDTYDRDPENRLLARGARFRLDAEVIRDQALYVSGLLNGDMYGKSVKPPQPPNLWKTVSMVSSSTYAFEADEGEKVYRRSLYSFWKRALPPPQMTIFDAPTRESCIARRERTNTPLQALVLMNEQQFFAAAKQLALRTCGTEDSFDDRLRLMFETCSGREPDVREYQIFQHFYEQIESQYEEQPELASEMVGATNGLEVSESELATWTMIANSIMNLDIVKSRN